MTDPVPSKDLDIPRFKQRIDHGDVIQSPSGEFVRYSDFHVVYDSHKWLSREKQRLEAVLRGIQSCSTCEACRGAATLALGVAVPLPTPLCEQLSDALVMLLNRRTYNDSGSRRSTILTNAIDDAIEAALTHAIRALTPPPGAGQ